MGDNKEVLLQIFTHFKYGQQHWSDSQFFAQDKTIGIQFMFLGFNTLSN